MHPLPHCGADVIRERARPAHRNSCCTDATRELVVEQCARPAPARIQPDRAAGADEVLAVPRLRDVQLHLEDLAPARHVQDLVHPRPHPRQHLDVAHAPDEDDAARRDSAGRRARDQVPDLHKVVRDARAAREENRRPVARERVVAGIGPFEVAGQVERVARRGHGAVVERAGHAGAGGHDQRDGGGRFVGGGGGVEGVVVVGLLLEDAG